MAANLDSASGSTSSSSSLPSSLSFLIANFQSFITIRLESSNYFAWKTQVENALKANDLFDFVNGSVLAPVSYVLDASGNKVVNPEFTRWTTVDRMLLSCLIATLTPSILPHIVGSDHTSQFWNKLEEKFSLLSRSHIHDFKRRLYNLNKTGSMEQYIDSIKEIVQKLAASGHFVEDEDLIFHALNGLKTGYSSFKQTIRTRTEPLSFSTFASMLMAEELHVENENSNITSILLTQNTGSANTSFQPGVHPSNGSPLPPLLPQSQPYQFPFPAPQQQQLYPSSYSGNQRNNRPNQRNTRYQNSNSGGGCQICGKTNHLAYLCYHRKNLSYRPMGNFGGNSGNFGGTSGNFGGSSGNFGGNSGSSRGPNGGYGSQGNYGNAGHTSQASAGYGPPNGAGFGPPNGSSSSTPPSGFSGFGGGSGPMPPASALFTTTDPMGYYNSGPSDGDYALGVNHAYASQQSVNPTPPPAPWFLNSGATSHVTHDTTQIQAHHGNSGPSSVMVGNGQTLQVAHSGQSHSSDSTSREVPQGALSHSSFF